MDLLRISQHRLKNNLSFPILVLLLISINHRVHFPIAAMVFYSKIVLLITIKDHLTRIQVICFQSLMPVVAELARIRKTLTYCLNKNFLSWLLIKNLKRWRIVWDYRNSNYKTVCWCTKREYQMPLRIQTSHHMKNCSLKIILNIINNHRNSKNTKRWHKISLNNQKDQIENQYQW